jgi:hypothetical protein
LADLSDEPAPRGKRALRIARRLAGFDEAGETSASHNASSCKQESSSDGVGGVAAAWSAEQPRFRGRQPRLGLPVPDKTGHAIKMVWRGCSVANAIATIDTSKI